MGLEQLELTQDLAGFPDIVLIEQCHVWRPRGGDACIAGARYAAVRLRDDGDGGTVRARNRGGVVIGAVVDHDDMQRHLLIQCAIERFTDDLAAVVGGENDVDERGWRRGHSGCVHGRCADSARPRRVGSPMTER